MPWIQQQPMSLFKAPGFSLISHCNSFLSQRLALSCIYPGKLLLIGTIYCQGTHMLFLCYRPLKNLCILYNMSSKFILSMLICNTVILVRSVSILIKTWILKCIQAVVHIERVIIHPLAQCANSRNIYIRLIMGQPLVAENISHDKCCYRYLIPSSGEDQLSLYILPSMRLLEPALQPFPASISYCLHFGRIEGAAN